MNVACNRHDDNLSILFVDFNQDFSSIQVGAKSGYSLLSTVGDQITETVSTTGEPFCIVGRLFNRSLVTLVSQNDMRKLLVSHSRINTIICHYRYSLTILAVKMNHQRLVVCVEDGIFIHNIRDMQMLHKVEETPPNRNGVLALSSAEDNCYLAYPGSHRVGTVFIFDALNFQNVTSIAAHDGLLAALAFNANATLLATASEKGTVIRVFSIPQGDKMIEFRRGLSRNVSICCLTFSLNNQYLVAASHTETVHVFKLESRSGSKATPDSGAHHRSRHRTTSSGSSASQGGSTGYGSGPSPDDLDIGGLSIGSDENVGGPSERSSPHAASDIPVQPMPSTGSWSSGLMGWMGSTLKAYSSYLPHQVSEIFAQDRAFAYCHLPTGQGSLFWTGAGRGSPVTGASVTGADGSGTGSQGVQPGIPQTFGLHKVAAVVFYQNQPRLIVAGLDGFVHTFAIDPVNGGEATLLRTQRLLSPNPQSGMIARPPLGQGTGSTLGCGDDDDDGEPTRTVCPQLAGGPHHPGVYVTPAPRSVNPPVRATTFAAAVASGPPMTEDRSSPVNQSDD